MVGEGEFGLEKGRGGGGGRGLCHNLMLESACLMGNNCGVRRRTRGIASSMDLLVAVGALQAPVE